MRMLRLSLAGTVILALLGGLSAITLAQDAEPAPITFVTGTVVEQIHHFEGEQGADVPPQAVRGYEITSRGVGVIEQLVDWSDPRLPSRHWINLNYTLVMKSPEDLEGAMAVTTSNLLEGLEGSWRGTGRAVEDDGDRYGFYELTGEGVYEGLWAWLRATPGMDVHGPWDQSYEGYIFEADPLLFPEAPVPVTTEG